MSGTRNVGGRGLPDFKHKKEVNRHALSTEEGVNPKCVWTGLHRRIMGMPQLPHEIERAA